MAKGSGNWEVRRKGEHGTSICRGREPARRAPEMLPCHHYPRRRDINNGDGIAAGVRLAAVICHEGQRHQTGRHSDGVSNLTWFFPLGGTLTREGECSDASAVEVSRQREKSTQTRTYQDKPMTRTHLLASLSFLGDWTRSSQGRALFS
jgi:hypothetical protein